MTNIKADSELMNTTNTATATATATRRDLSDLHVQIYKTLQPHAVSKLKCPKRSTTIYLNLGGVLNFPLKEDLICALHITSRTSCRALHDHCSLVDARLRQRTKEVKPILAKNRRSSECRETLAESGKRLKMPKSRGPVQKAYTKRLKSG